MMAAVEPKIELPDVGVVPGATRIVDDVYNYDERVDQIGEGTYGKVYKGTDKKGEKVALKMIRMDNEKEGFPITAIREIKLLSTLKHENIVNLREIVRSRVGKEDKYRGNIFMVFDYAEYDLTGMQEAVKPKGLTLPQVKCIMLQLLRGLAYCHKNGILHRDLKASNLLITQAGILKIADFGLARNYNDEQGKMTNRVITLWYRPPELLLGSERYGPEIDVWSCGCIFAELLAKKPLFPGKNESEQLDYIFRLMGAPTKENWPAVVDRPKDFTFFEQVKVQNYKKTPENFDAWCNSHGVKGDCAELLKSMLALDPSRRITATEAALHPYFYDRKEPACDPNGLPKIRDCHEWTTKNAKKKQAEQQQQQQRHQQHHHHQQPYSHQGGHHTGYGQQQQHGVPPHGGPHYSTGPPVAAAAGGQQQYPRNVRPRTSGPVTGPAGGPPAAAARGGYLPPGRQGGGYGPQGTGGFGGYHAGGGSGYALGGGGGFGGHHQQVPPVQAQPYGAPPQQQQQRGGYQYGGQQRR